MAYNDAYFAKVSSGDGEVAPQTFNYATSVDAMAVVSAAGYFDAHLSGIKVNDILFTICSDGNQMLYVTAATTTVETAAF